MRAAARHERQFGGPKRDWIALLGCIVPRCGRSPCDPHHATSRGAGGDAADLVPLCHYHHHEGHAVGWRTFEARHVVDLEQEAARLEALWTRLRPELVP